MQNFNSTFDSVISGIDLGKLEELRANTPAVAQPKSLSKSAPSVSEFVGFLKNTLTTHWLLVMCVAFIAFVSMVDVYWSFKTQAILAETELNPIGRFLIRIDGGDIALFMTLKMVGNLIAILIIPAIYTFKKSWGMTTAIAIATFQLLLLLFLNFGHLI